MDTLAKDRLAAGTLAADLVVTKVSIRHGRPGQPTTLGMERLAELIGSRQMEAPTPAGRNRLPYIIFSGLFGRSGLHDFRQPTGLVLLHVEMPAEAREAALVRQRLQLLPETLLAFTDYSRRTLYIVVRCTSADGLLPADSIAYLSHLKLAQQQAARYLEARTECRVARQQETLTRGCRLCHDAEVYYNAAARDIVVVAGLEVLRQQYPLARTDRDGITDSEPSWQQIERERQEYYACLDRAWTMADADCPGGDMDGAAGAVDEDDPLFGEALVTRLAELCHKAGLPEEACVRRTGAYSRWHLSVDDVRRIFRTAYRRNTSGRRWSAMTEKERIARRVRDFFERRYELRYNVMRQSEEFRPRGVDYHPWQPLTERDINRIGQEQMLDCGAAWPIDIRQYAQSSIVSDYNPVHEFLAGCGEWDRRRDYIGLLAGRVPTATPHWRRLFHRWFLGMVAQWLGYSRDHGNAVVPMLIGPQGCRKSTFCRLLLPRSLREYYIDDVKLDNAEQTERMLCRMALVNIDEYNAKTDREQAKLKRLLTERDVQVRRMRSDQYLLLQRMASFVATTNERQPLTDRTGSRRYLCCEVSGTIDTVSPLNYQQLYAQALYELEHGEPYWMSPDEERLMADYNLRFQQTTTAELLLETYYEPAPRQKRNFVRAVDILENLQQHARGTDRPNMQQLLRALKAQRYEYGAIAGLRGWYAKVRSVKEERR